MGNPFRKIKERNKAISTITSLMENPDKVIVIHYSCESFYDRLDGSSPRITSIAVRNLATGQTKSFSIHQMAEKNKIARDGIEQDYDRLENLMLSDFYEYVERHEGYTYLHWNMRDINYGFQAIAHRYRVLGGQPLEIHESNLVDLARLVVSIYGVGYIGHPRLEKLVEKNNISNRDFLSGADEAIAFTNKDYVKLHQSTLRKVDVLANIIERVDTNSLKTNSTWHDKYGSYPAAIGEFIKEHWIFVILGWVITIVSLMLTIIIK